MEQKEGIVTQSGDGAWIAFEGSQFAGFERGWKTQFHEYRWTNCVFGDGLLIPARPDGQPFSFACVAEDLWNA